MLNLMSFAAVSSEKEDTHLTIAYLTSMHSLLPHQILCCNGYTKPGSAS